MLTEPDFLVREFPSPSGPHRPLALTAPEPGFDAARIGEDVARLAEAGYGGLVLDPALFSLGILGEEWFETVGRYVEACRLAGLYLWLLDGFTAGEALAAVLDEAVPGWRGSDLSVLRTEVQGGEHLTLAMTDRDSRRLMGVMARSLEGGETINLLSTVRDGQLRWEAPPGRWEICRFTAGAAQGPAEASFNWVDTNSVAAWLVIGFEQYRERLAEHLGRTLRGFFIFCPGWPRAGASWPLLTAGNPTFQDLAGLASGKTGSYYGRAAESLRQSYLGSIRDWCWRNRLRVAGYRLGGSPVTGALAALDLGGLPDLRPESAPDLDELAGLAGLARFHRQERVAHYLALTGEMLADRRAVSEAAAAGADLLLVRPPADQPGGERRVLNDFVARVTMAVAAGGPAEETVLVLKDEPGALAQLGRKVRELAALGVEALCLPAAESVSLGEVDAHNQAIDQTALAGSPLSALEICGLGLPDRFSARVRRAESWTVYTLFNLTAAAWRGPVEVKTEGPMEIWSPASGEQRAAALLDGGGTGRLALSVEPGEAVVVVAKKKGRQGLPPKSRLIQAHLALGRSWTFEAKGGNILPLDWVGGPPGVWTASFIVLSALRDLRLEEAPAEAEVLLNGAPIVPGEGGYRIAAGLTEGRNVLEIRNLHRSPQAKLRGDFICRGEAIMPSPSELSGPWTLNGYPYFNGPGLYRQTVRVPAELIRPGLQVWLEIAALAETAAVALNGRPAGFLAWPPYRLDLGPAENWQAGSNLLELEVRAPASRSAWSFKGLLGEVSLLFVETGQVDDLFAALGN